MKLTIFGIFSVFVNLSHCSKLTSNTYEVLKGIKLLSPYKTITLSRNITTMCVAFCLSEDICKSTNYNQNTRTCELNLLSPLDESSRIEEDTSWKIFYTKDDTWDLIFRGTGGIGVKIYDSYIGSVSLAEPEVGCLLTHNLSCTTHYRNAIIDNWNTQNIRLVKVAMYRGNSMVMNIVFSSMSGDSNTDWFNKDRIVSTSYTDLTEPGQTFNFFSIAGDSQVQRRFYVNNKYGGCNVDEGWIAVYDSGPNCQYEQGLQYPAVTYMSNNNIGHWDTSYQIADVLAIFIQKN